MEYDQLTGLFKSLFGLALGPEKRYLITMRLEGVMKKHNLGSYQELIYRCQSSNSADLKIDVIDAMTTHETSFFRDNHPFQALESKILPELVERFNLAKLTGRDKIRIWSAACSTGQEAYSLAILIDELCRRLQPTNSCKPNLSDFRIVATDISTQAVSDARGGQYSQFEIDRGLSELRKQQYFTQNGNNYQIREELKRITEFRQGNILQRSSMPTEVDLILCRNVLIYFDDAHRAQLMEKLVECLCTGGYLILGAAEITSYFPRSLEQHSIGPTIVYRKR
jgi:chemotaxis protein methyltransferase CheR